MKVSGSPHLDGTGGQGEVSGASQTSARVQRGYGVGVRLVTTSTFTHFLMLFHSVSVLDVKFMCMTACVCVLVSGSHSFESCLRRLHVYTGRRTVVTIVLSDLFRQMFQQLSSSVSQNIYKLISVLDPQPQALFLYLGILNK